MKIDVRHEFPYSAETVYHVFRDRMQEYVRFCPNLTKVVIEQRMDVSETITEMRVRWHGLGQIPELIRHLLKPEMISWEDWETWDSTARECRWVIKPFYFREFVKCEGAWRFESLGENKCAARCDGVFIVDIKKFPPFPEFIVKKASPAIEKMIGSYLEPNLKSVFKAVNDFISSSTAKK